MLKPIHHVACSPALRACRGLQERLLVWLCDPATDEEVLVRANLPGPSAIEADWLWAFLNKTDDRRLLLERALVLAAMTNAEKAALLAWGQSVADVARQFQPNPPPWPVQAPAISGHAWYAFKQLMEAFYKKGLQDGLPYDADGLPVAVGGVCYLDFVQAFRDAHRLPDASPDVEGVCVLCGGPLGDTPQVDHWIAKHAFPLLSVCADNLLPICGDCNSSSNKGRKPVYDKQGFADWFHPYLRPTAGPIQLGYRFPEIEITLSVADPADAFRLHNLDNLLKLSARWTRKFKAGYISHQDSLKRLERKRLRQGLPRHSYDEIKTSIEDFRDGLPEYEPFYEVQQVLAQALLDPARLAALQVELVDVT